MDMKAIGDAYWKGVPDELKCMCLAEVWSSGSYCTEPVIRYLMDRMNDCDSVECGVTAYDVIKWIDHAIDACLFPLELHDEYWIDNRENILKILNRSEELIKCIEPEIFSLGYRRPDDVMLQFNIVEYVQNLNVYFSVLYLFDEDEKNLRERLEMSVEDSKRNLEYMKTCPEYELYKGTTIAEPIRRLKSECLPDSNISEVYYEIYRRYLSEIGE